MPLTTCLVWRSELQRRSSRKEEILLLGKTKKNKKSLHLGEEVKIYRQMGLLSGWKGKQDLLGRVRRRDRRMR